MLFKHQSSWFASVQCLVALSHDIEIHLWHSDTLPIGFLKELVNLDTVKEGTRAIQARVAVLWL